MDVGKIKKTTNVRLIIFHIVTEDLFHPSETILEIKNKNLNIEWY